MAIALEFVSVVIKKSSLEKQYPGGVNALVRLDLPNFTEDENLVRVGFMSTQEAYNLTDALLDRSVDLAQGPAVIYSGSDTPEWLATGIIDSRSACWLAGESPGDVVEFVPGFLLCCPQQIYAQLDQLLETHD